MQSFLKKLFIGLLGLVLTTITLIYIFQVDYILKGIRVIYLNGEKTAFLDDYKYFDNHIIETATVQPWKNATEKIVLSDDMKSFHEKIRSVAYVIIHKDSVISESYFGGYDALSKSNSFSMAKSIVAAILGKLIANGDIKSLDQKIIDFVPEIIGSYAQELTFRDLVSMSSGMKWEEDYYNPFSITTQLYFDKNLVTVFKKLPIEKKPGQKFIYQSGDTQLLGIAIQRATKSTLSKLLSDYFWKPMGAEHEALWQIDSEKNGIEKAYCCIAGSAKDFARFGKLYLHKGNWNGVQLLPEAYVEESLKPRFTDAPIYGYGWWMGNINDKPYFYMDGHLGQYVIVIPQDELIIVRLGHQMDGKAKSNPDSAFQRFIKDAYVLLGDRSTE